MAKPERKGRRHLVIFAWGGGEHVVFADVDNLDVPVVCGCMEPCEHLLRALLELRPFKTGPALKEGKELTICGVQQSRKRGEPYGRIVPTSMAQRYGRRVYVDFTAEAIDRVRKATELRGIRGRITKMTGGLVKPWVEDG